MSRRRIVLQFYFDLCEDYAMYRFLPHIAMSIYDGLHSIDALGTFDERVRAAAFFMIAQKNIDKHIVNKADLADACVCRSEEITRCEPIVWQLIIRENVCLFPEKRFNDKLLAHCCLDRKMAFVLFDASLTFSDSLDNRILSILLILADQRLLGNKTFDVADVDVQVCRSSIESWANINLVIPKVSSSPFSSSVALPPVVSPVAPSVDVLVAPVDS